MPRLLILCEYPTVLGGERSMLATLPAVAAAGFEICIAAPATGALPALLDDRCVPRVTWTARIEANHRLPLAELRESLAAVIRRTAPDLVHANSLSTARIAGPVIRALGVRSIGHLRDILNLSASAIADLNQHSTLIAVSHATRNFHQRQGINLQKCRVLYNGIDLDEFRPRPATRYLHRELQLPQQARFIAVIGQLGIRKGTDVALLAAQHTVAQFPETHWLLIGERTSSKAESRDFEIKLQQMSSTPPLVGHVHFLGNRADIATLLPECTLLVHTAHQEPLGRVLLEAIAAGTSIVATNVGGTREIIPPGEAAGILVPKNDPAAIAQAAASLLSDESRRVSMALYARHRAEQAFDIRDASRRLIEQYEAALT
ncbi:MAG TPA: glycosyltransferase family 4 protein [Lacipirellulaceae bacterium]|jgi:glycosyltransferase involved in cell wall biosynthesis|nr:glycosyltransferase family 4 protein [Lacipirellulaceae bacterium]